MDENKTSGGGNTFGFNKPSSPNLNKEDSNSSPVEEEAGLDQSSTDQISQHKAPALNEDDDLDAKYLDKRSVTINLVKNYSMFRRANDKVLDKKKDYIGSSVNSSMVLSSNKEEIETYFPSLIGLAHNNPEFITRVKGYLNNIRTGVDELGVTFDTSFVYKTKRLYLSIRKQEEEIEAEYSAIPREDMAKLKAALEERIKSLNALESTKYDMGYPINLADYLMYRHCLLYKDVAKDVAFINSDPNIRFFFKDDIKEAEKLRKYRNEINKAKSNYVSCLRDDVLFNAIYTQVLANENLPVIAGLSESLIEKESKMDRFSTNEPVKFNALFNNKDAVLIGDIEYLVAKGHLIRSSHNQNITADDGTFIGSNMKEAVTWFKSPDNASFVNAYRNRLKNN